MQTLGRGIGDALSPWVPATHAGDSDRVWGSWLWADPVLAVVGIWGEPEDGRTLCVSVDLCLLNRR